MKNRSAAALAEEARSKYRLRQEAMLHAATVDAEASVSTGRGSTSALEVTLASISDEVTTEAQERRDREAKLR
jgi:hypothetical protein